jgi:hypothetical protein
MPAGSGSNGAGIGRVPPVTLGFLITIVGLLSVTAGGVWSVARYLSGVDVRLARIEDKLSHVEREAITHSTFMLWAERLKTLNPELEMPRCSDIFP